MPKIVGVVAQKGGVGKTTTAMGLAATAASRGYKVFLLDVDRQASASWWGSQIGINKLPFDLAKSQNSQDLARVRTLPHDLVIIDTPGSLDGYSIMDAVVRSVDYALMPVATSALELSPILETISKVIVPRGKQYGVMLNRVRTNAGARETEDFRSILQARSVNFLKAGLRDYKVHRQAPMESALITEYSGTYGLAANGDLARVLDELSLAIGMIR